MRRVTTEERALFLAALSGHPRRAVAKKTATVTKTTPANTPKPTIIGGKRQISDEELDLFLQAIGKRPKPALPAPAPPLQVAVKPRPPKPAGIDGNTKRRLEKGDLHPTAKLDLHGLTEAAAHGALLTFLHTAHRRGDRLVLIVTGKGPLEETAPRARYGGVLRRAVPRWLEEAPMASIIADKRWAHRRHGGDGALYIYLRKR